MHTHRGELELVPSCADYAEAFLRWREDEVTRRYNPLACLNLESCREKLTRDRNDLSHFDEAEAFRWFVRRDRELVGTVSVKEINRRMLLAEVGYSVAPEHRGQGIGGTAVGLMITTVFERTPLRKLVAYVHEDNVASRRLLERLGFACEGILREHYLIEGQPVNQALYGLLAQKWRLA